ncbi:uncharacterized protein [Palaemon carinicauda]|uniref:uncharacterized protein n=1 Tax=Palaemon carinicauda TaxID=392227 RepID=UPI0035B6A5F7
MSSPVNRGPSNPSPMVTLVSARSVIVPFQGRVNGFLPQDVESWISDHIEQVCRFLPPQELPENSDLQPDNLQESLNGIKELLERYEEIRQKERLTSTRRLGELFHTYREKGKVSIRVDIGTVFSSHVCDDKATCPSCQKEQYALIQRFKGGPYSSSALDLSETSTRQEYTIDGESCEDITDILNEDGFIRGWKRTTC